MGLWLAACTTALAAALGVEAGSGRVAFQLASSLHPVEGQARSYSGHLDTDALTGELTVDATSLTTGLGPRDSRLLAWCLEVTRFPTVALVLARVDGAVADLRKGAGSGAITLFGTLTIRDVARDVSIPATFAWEGDKLRIKGRHEMKWTDWNIPDPSTLLSTVAPEMSVSFDVLARPS